MPLVLIDRTTGTNIGDLTSDAGLAGAFDGTTDQGFNSCANKSGTSGYVGKTLATTRQLARAIVYGGNGSGHAQGFAGGSASTTVTINIRAKTGGAPASRTDGTVIGTTSFSDTNNQSAGKTIDSTSTAGWDNVWADISASGGGPSELFVAELVLYSIAIPAQAVIFT